MVGCACWLSRRHHVQAAPRAPGARSPEHCAQGRGSRRFSRRVQRAKSSCSTLAHTHCGSTPGSAHGLRPWWGQLVVPFPGFSPTFSDPGARHVSVRQGPASTVTVLVVVRGSRNRQVSLHPREFQCVLPYFTSAFLLQLQLSVQKTSAPASEMQTTALERPHVQLCKD